MISATIDYICLIILMAWGKFFCSHYWLTHITINEYQKPAGTRCVKSTRYQQCINCKNSREIIDKA